MNKTEPSQHPAPYKTRKAERRRLAALIHVHEHAAEAFQDLATEEHHSIVEFEGKRDVAGQKIIVETLSRFAAAHENWKKDLEAQLNQLERGDHHNHVAQSI